MAIKDRLQLILITYNRDKFVRQTLSKIFNEKTPISDFDFLVIDNNSTDNTVNVVKEFAEKHKNIRYIKNKYNIGISGNIARAMELADKDYVWILGDDDVYDFSNWGEVENAINNNEKLICVARYVLPEEHKYNLAYQLFQLTFITGGIYSTSLFNDTTMRNTMDNIFTLFPHMFPIVSYINSGGKVYVVDKPISDNGWKIEQKDCSYIRGHKDVDNLCERTRLMSWVLGYANVVSCLKDKKLAQECMEISIPYQDIYGSWDNFYNCMYNMYIKAGKIDYFMEICNVLPPQHQQHFTQFMYSTYFANNYISIVADKYGRELKSLYENIDNFKMCVEKNNKELNNKLTSFQNCIDGQRKKSKNAWYKKLFSVNKTHHHRYVRIFGVKFNIGKIKNVEK